MKKSIIFFMLILSTLLFATGCGSNSEKDTDSSTQKASANSSVSKDTIFKYYNKVEIGMTKSDIDAALALTPKAEAQVDNSFNYADSKGFGVYVAYDKDNKAMAKTVIYKSNSDIAPFCKKSVTEKQCDKVTKNMTYDQVKDLLGGDGIEVCCTLGYDGKCSTIKRWANEDGSCAQINFSPENTVTYAMFSEQ